MVVIRIMEKGGTIVMGIMARSSAMAVIATGAMAISIAIIITIISNVLARCKS